MTSPFLQKINNIKNEFFMNFWKKYVPSDEIKLRDEITGFDGIQHPNREHGRERENVNVRYIAVKSDIGLLLHWVTQNGLMSSKF